MCSTPLCDCTRCVTIAGDHAVNLVSTALSATPQLDTGGGAFFLAFHEVGRDRLHQPLELVAQVDDAGIAGVQLLQVDGLLRFPLVAVVPPLPSVAFVLQLPV